MSESGKGFVIRDVLYFFTPCCMTLHTPLSIVTALTLLTGSIPATLALSSSDTSSTPWYDTTTSSSSSSSDTSDYWNTQSSSDSSAWLQKQLHPDCAGMTGSALDECLQQLGVFPETQNGASWLPMGSTWLSNMPNLQCDTYTSADRAACQQQVLTNWMTAYRALHTWVDQMDLQMQDQMRTAGLSDAQIADISAGLTTTQVVNNTGYATTEDMRDAWKVCQQFDGRTQARCMRDALTSSNGDNRFRDWTALDGLVNGNDSSTNTRSSSSSSVSTY